jgi:hypothetical protein
MRLHAIIGFVRNQFALPCDAQDETSESRIMPLDGIRKNEQASVM